MTKMLFSGAFILGALAILWIGRIFLGADNLGLGVTVLIAMVYTIGTLELLQFRRATATLNEALNALTQPLDDLYKWLLRIDPSLQNAVRLRVEGERNGLPAPVLTPYLVGLLVMLGLLGTFVGMVDTLKGAVVALQGTSELEAIRAGLAAPIAGLGLAFGTSVAGVAASAMLGLLSTISRRERLQASHLLDTHVGTTLRPFSAKYQQHLAFQAMQDQAAVMPAVADQLSALANSLEASNNSMTAQILQNQEHFQNTITGLYHELNESVDQSLKTTLVESAGLINASVQPIAEQTLSQLSAGALETQQQLIKISHEQLAAINQSTQENNQLLSKSSAEGLAQQAKSTADLIAQVNNATLNANQQLSSNSAALLQSFSASTEQWAEQQREQAKQFSNTIGKELNSLTQLESDRGSAAVQQLSELQAVVTAHLTTLGTALEEPMARLIETASQTPKAAADVIEKLRGEMSKNLERDNDLLLERTSLMAQLSTLAESLEQSAIGQRDAIDSMVERSTETLSKVGQEFALSVEGEAEKMAGMVDQFASSSTEMASLGDAFNSAVMIFSESNNLLIENLSNIQASLEQSNSRSDEQLAYYVAQAREIIDHNLLSHKQIIDAMNASSGDQTAMVRAVSS
ncbi:MAG: hypothetical protein ACJAYF_000612 [Arenicella sp.]|jgi:hypothetical protein